MSQWLHRHASTSVQLGIAATLGAVAATTIIFSTLAIRRRIATEDLKASIPELSTEHHALQLTEYGGPSRSSITNIEDTRAARVAARARKGMYDEDLILEQLARNRVFLKDDGLQKLRNSFIVVIGLGGVGSHCVAALARSGVSKIRVVDFDQVTLSSLNRHALATLADVGTPKVHCVRKRLEQICPWVRIECRNELFNSSSAKQLLGDWDFELRDEEDTERRPDWVIDAIDNIDSKVALLQYCVVHDIKVISSMGAGCKGDPTRIQVGDISASFEDPLSQSTRRRLRILGVKDGIPVVFSTEKPGIGKAELVPIDEKEFEKGSVGNLGVLPDFRVRILPVLGTIPAVFGYTVANHVICSISDYPMDYRVSDKGRSKMYDGILALLQGAAERLVRSEGGDAVGLRIPVSKDDVSYLVEEVFRGKSVVSGLTNRLALVPWRRPSSGFQASPKYEAEGQKLMPLGFSDLVLMTKEESQKHEKEVLQAQIQPEEFYEAAVIRTVERRHREEKLYQRYR